MTKSIVSALLALSVLGAAAAPAAAFNSKLNVKAFFEKLERERR